MKKILLISISLLLSMGVALAQRVVSGKVTSDDGSGGIPGVNIVLEGTTNGTTTDFDGNFSLTVSNENFNFFNDRHEIPKCRDWGKVGY